MSLLRAASSLTKTVLSALSVARTASVDGSAIDFKNYEGNIAIHMIWTHVSGTNPTWTWKLQTSADGSTGWADVTGVTIAAAADGDDIVVVHKGKLKRYVRIVGTIGGTSTPTIATAAYAYGWLKVAV